MTGDVTVAGIRERSARLEAEVAREALSGTPDRLHLLGEGTAAIMAGLVRLEPLARESVCNLQPEVPFDPEDPGLELTDRSVRRGLRMELITTQVAAEQNPLLGSTHPHTRIGPVFAKALLVDDRVAVLAGPRTASGAVTAWTSRDPFYVDQVRALWAATLPLSRPLVAEGVPTLDRRQVQVARRVACGETDATIARELGISVRTVERDVRATLAFLGARTRAEAVLVMRGRASARMPH